MFGFGVDLVRRDVVGLYVCVVEVVCVGLLVMSVNLWRGCLVVGVVRVCITLIC